MTGKDASRKPPPPHAPLLQMAYGALTTQILCVAAQLGLAERLAQEGPSTAEKLAPEVGTAASIVERILRALVSLGVCEEIDDNRFRLTALGEFLRPSHPDSVEARVLLNGQVFYRMWGDLIETVRTGESGPQRVVGMPLYEYFVSEPQIGALFDRTMTSVARHRHRPAVDAYDFGQFATLVDVGGGDGGLMTEILKVFPQSTGIVFDLPRAAANAQESIDAAGLTDRCRFVGGDAFQSVPAGADAYILSNFVVSWGDDQAAIPLRNCRDALAKNGKVLLIEWIMPAGTEPREGFWPWDTTVAMDLNMLALFGAGSGRVRTLSGFRDLLAAAGFEMIAVIPTSGSISVIEARPLS